MKRRKGPGSAPRTPAASRRARSRRAGSSDAIRAGRFRKRGVLGGRDGGLDGGRPKTRALGPQPFSNELQEHVRGFPAHAEQAGVQQLRRASSGSRTCAIQAVSRAISGASSGGIRPRMNAASSRVSSQASSQRRSASARDAVGVLDGRGKRRKLLLDLPHHHRGRSMRGQVAARLPPAADRGPCSSRRSRAWC